MAELSRKELLKVMQNELACVHRQFGEMCDNGRDCSTCELCLPEEMIVNAYRQIISKLETEPTADVAEVKHGEWELKSEIRQLLDDCDEDTYVECPFCKRTFYVPFEFEDEKMFEYARKNYPYCNCGAKMDGGKAV